MNYFVACMEGNWGSNCEENCSCITDNTMNCNKTDGMCNCKTGWEGTSCETDINECLNANKSSQLCTHLSLIRSKK
jgi:hypothetical protein